MALNGKALKSKMSERIFQGMKRVYTEVNSTQGYSPVVEAQWKKMADAISDIALDIVSDIQANAEVKPGISVATTGSPGAHTGNTTGTGKIT